MPRCEAESCGPVDGHEPTHPDCAATPRPAPDGYWCVCHECKATTWHARDYVYGALHCVPCIEKGGQTEDSWRLERRLLALEIKREALASELSAVVAEIESLSRLKGGV